MGFWAHTARFAFHYVARTAAATVEGTLAEIYVFSGSQSATPEPLSEIWLAGVDRARRRCAFAAHRHHVHMQRLARVLGVKG